MLTFPTQASVLNNLGCLFLQSGAWAEALASFQDALDYWQSDVGDNTLSQQQHRERRITGALNRLETMERRIINDSDVTVVRFDDDSMSHLACQTSFADLRYFIVLEPQHIRDVDVESAVMLHNFAYAHIVLARRGILSDNQAHRGALYIFRAAYKILSERMAALATDEMKPSNSDTYYCGIVVVLSKLVYTLNHQGYERAARDGLVQLRDFQQKFLRIEALSRFFEMPMAAAAA